MRIGEVPENYERVSIAELPEGSVLVLVRRAKPYR
jgi:hypothetical protein